MYYTPISDERVTEIARLAGTDIETAESWLYADWREGDEHQDWIETAPVAEIADWLAYNIQAAA